MVYVALKNLSDRVGNFEFCHHDYAHEFLMWIYADVRSLLNHNQGNYKDTIMCTSVITARIRRMTEGNVFTLSIISGRGGTPSDVCGWGGGTPSQVWMVGGRYPSQVWMVGGGTLARSGWWGVPCPRSGWWGYPRQVWMMGGGTPARSGW